MSDDPNSCPTYLEALCEGGGGLRGIKLGLPPLHARMAGHIYFILFMYFVPGLATGKGKDLDQSLSFAGPF